jgi:hypothetical protein
MTDRWKRRTKPQSAQVGTKRPNISARLISYPPNLKPGNAKCKFPFSSLTNSHLSWPHDGHLREMPLASRNRIASDNLMGFIVPCSHDRQRSWPAEAGAVFHKQRLDAACRRLPRKQEGHFSQAILLTRILLKSLSAFDGIKSVIYNNSLFCRASLSENRSPRQF